MEDGREGLGHEGRQGHGGGQWPGRGRRCPGIDLRWGRRGESRGWGGGRAHDGPDSERQIEIRRRRKRGPGRGRGRRVRRQPDSRSIAATIAANARPIAARARPVERCSRCWIRTLSPPCQPSAPPWQALVIRTVSQMGSRAHAMIAWPGVPGTRAPGGGPARVGVVAGWAESGVAVSAGPTPPAGARLKNLACSRRRGWRQSCSSIKGTNLVSGEPDETLVLLATLVVLASPEVRSAASQIRTRADQLLRASCASCACCRGFGSGAERPLRLGPTTRATARAHESPRGAAPLAAPWTDRTQGSCPSLGSESDRAPVAPSTTRIAEGRTRHRTLRTLGTDLQPTHPSLRRRPTFSLPSVATSRSGRSSQPPSRFRPCSQRILPPRHRGLGAELASVSSVPRW